MHNNAIIFSILCFFMFSGCSKSEGEKPCDPSRKPVVTTNSPVMAGETVQLSVSGINDVAIINWHGPDNFLSHESNPEIPMSTGFAAGRYTADVITKSGCIYTATTDSVIINGSEPACQLNDNTARLIRSSTQFHSIEVTGQTQVIADSYDEDLTLTFKTPGAPPSGIYRITPQPQLRSDVDVTFLGQGAYFYGLSGNVIVKSENNKTIITFCDIEFKETWGTLKLKGSARLVF